TLNNRIRSEPSPQRFLKTLHPWSEQTHRRKRQLVRPLVVEKEVGPSVRRLAPTSFGSDRLYQRRRCHPFDVAKWRRRVGGVSVRTVLDVAQSAYVRNNVPADQRRRR
ncbi:hypothetical protein ALC53_00800, partial [Atta colombica]